MPSADTVKPAYVVTSIKGSSVLSSHFYQTFAVIRVLPFLNNPKDLDPSCKTDLDFWDCFGRKKHHLISEEIRY